MVQSLYFLGGIVMKFDLYQSAQDHRLIVCHRGVTGGNIPCNTMPAYEIALLQGADMIETDVSKTADDQLVIFHPRMESRHLGKDCCIPQMTWEEVSQLRYINMNHTPTQFGLLKLDELLEHFKGRCYINIDKFWSAPAEIYKCLKRHGMMDQVLVKSPPTEEVLTVLEQIGPDVPYMPVMYEGEDLPHRILIDRNINYVGVEVVYPNEDSIFATEEFVENLQKDRKLVWVNSIIYNTKKQLSGGHSDDSAFTVSMEHGWGWLADKGYDMIQTDWPAMLIDFLKSTNRYYR